MVTDTRKDKFVMLFSNYRGCHTARKKRLKVTGLSNRGLKIKRNKFNY